MATAERLCECSICMEVYTDPRVLPCGHTFCRQCIVASGRLVFNWHGIFFVLACPVCRKELKLPHNEVADLPKNFALLDMPEPKELPSEACSGDVVKAATVYCVECEHKLCRDCEKEHKKSDVTRRHQTVDVDSAGRFIVKLAE